MILWWSDEPASNTRVFINDFCHKLEVYFQAGLILLKYAYLLSWPWLVILEDNVHGPSVAALVIEVVIKSVFAIGTT